MTMVGLTLVVLSCGDGAVEPAPPPPAPVATTVAVNPASATLTSFGETTRFTAEVRDQNGQVMAGAAVAWATSDASVAAVDASGQVTAAANGSATITATAGSVSGTAGVTVEQAVSAVNVSPAADTLVTFGDTVRLVAEATDANGHGVAGLEFSWSSSDTLVARVDDSGLVTAAGNGSATVTAMAGGASGAAAVGVMQAPESVAVSPEEATIAALGDTVRLAAEAFDANGHAVANAELAWATSDEAVATVDGSGLVTAAGHGTATITATSGGASGTASVAVPNVDAIFDSLMLAFTTEQNIGAAALGIMKDGEIVYNRAFGWMNRERTIPIRQDVMMRLASVTKPITAAAIHELALDGKLDLDDFVFDLGQPDGGILDLEPFPVLGDPRLADITVWHLLLHRGGWDRDVAGDPTGDEIEMAAAMSIPSPPGAENGIRYMLGQPLQFDPGSERAYSGIGYQVLGLVIEEVSGEDYLSAVRREVFAPLGVRSDDVIQGRTFPKDRSDREPWYDYGDFLTDNVYDPTGPRVRWPDGGSDREARIARGGLAASTEPILRFLDVYRVYGNDIGERRHRRHGTWCHNGSIPGTNTIACHRGDEINYVVLFNRRRRKSEGEGSYVWEIHDMIADILDNTPIIWPRSRRVVGTGGEAAHR